MYPLIILGAGASYDYMDRDSYLKGPFDDLVIKQYRPPLLKDIFNPSTFLEFLREYTDAASLASGMTNEGDFEAYLTDIQDNKAPKNKERYKQLISLRFYLRKLFLTISEQYWRPVNYYHKILNTIKDEGVEACFVNFNYDLLLEKNIPHIITSNDINSYISEKIKVIKIHGACNWFYRASIIEGEENKPDVYTYFMNFAENFSRYANEERPDKHPIIQTQGVAWGMKEDDENETRYYLPALAIPVTTKSNHICPTTHIEELEKAIDKIDRILIIGWSANDHYLVNLLNERIKRHVGITIVTGLDPKDIMKKFMSNNFQLMSANANNFSTFIKSGEVNNFFKN